MYEIVCSWSPDVCDRTATTLLSDASLSMTKGLLKSGLTKTEAFTKALLIPLNAAWAFSFYSITIRLTLHFNKSLIGETIVAKCLTERLYHDAILCLVSTRRSRILYSYLQTHIYLRWMLVLPSSGVSKLISKDNNAPQMTVILLLCRRQKPMALSLSLKCFPSNAVELGLH